MIDVKKLEDTARMVPAAATDEVLREMREPVAYCCPDDPAPETAFAWAGTARDTSKHTMPLIAVVPATVVTEAVPLMPSAEDAAQKWLADTGRLPGPVGVSAEQASMMRLGFEEGYRAATKVALGVRHE